MPYYYIDNKLEEHEDLEKYVHGGFHPVHLGDVYDGRYLIVHKLGFGGFSTVWLARDVLTNRWVALKIIISIASTTYDDRSVITSHLGSTGSRLFVNVDRRFWIDGPNGRHLCLVLPVLGPNLSRLSKGIYSRLKPAFARQVSLQAARALAHLHSNGLCHGGKSYYANHILTYVGPRANLVTDFTPTNMVLRLTNEFDSYNEHDLFTHFGCPRTAPLQTYSYESPAPFGPDYIVEPLDFCSSTTNVLSSELCIIDYDQSFTTTSPPTSRPDKPGIIPRYLAPEVAVGWPLSPASDVWALGCVIFRMRSGNELFDWDTSSPADVLIQMNILLGELPEEWKQTKFDEDGWPVEDGEEGTTLQYSAETQLLKDRVRQIPDEPPGLFISRSGQVVRPEDVELEPVPFNRLISRTIPYSPALNSMVWKPSAVCVDGFNAVIYSARETGSLKAFPRIQRREALLLLDILSKVFTYDPATRPKAEDLVTHPWFHLAEGSQ